MANHHIEVTGHRGAAAVEPENTLRGVRYALTLDVDRVEIDVHLTQDQQLVVMHDATVDRTTDGTGKIAELTLEEIKQLDAGQGERVPTLQEVIDVLQEKWQHNSKPLLLIELKGEATASPTVEVVQRNGIEKRVVLMCFTAERVAEAKRLLPQSMVGFISSSLDPDPVEIALRVGAGSVHVNHQRATREWVDRAREAGLFSDIWNIDDAERMKWAISLGVDGISSNDPALLLEVIRAQQ